MVEGQFLDAACARAGFAALPPRDRSFARALLNMALRRLGEIDALIKARLHLPLPQDAAGIAGNNLLRLALAEMLFMRTPDYAAVDAAVRGAKKQAPRFAKLVNAVLRGVGRDAPKPLSPNEAALLNTPQWLQELLVADWGEAAAKDMLVAHLEEPPLDLTPKDPQQLTQWAEKLGGEEIYAGSIRLRDAGAVSELEGYAQGDWWVQDVAATLPARLLAPAKGARVADLCAAPGGKTLQLASMGADVTAIELSGKRMARIEENLSRCGLSARLHQGDVLTFKAKEPFDAVLLDAPCSASGTIRRHPDMPHLKVAGGVKGLSELQDAMLDAAWRMLKPGGALVYCTCSIFKAEGEERAAAFLKRCDNAQIAPAAAELSPTPEGWLRLSPNMLKEQGGMDGFFAVKFEKKLA